MAKTIAAGGHLDRPLSNLAVKAFASGEQSGFVGQRLFPVVPVGKQSNKYYTIDKDSWIRRHDANRSPGVAANRVEWRVSSDSYFADNRALAVEHPIEHIANADEVLQTRQTDTEFLVDGLLRDLEIRIANKVTSISNIGSGATLTGNDQWTAVQSADILAQVHTGQAFIQSQTGMVPNTMVMDWDSFQLARRNERLLEHFKHTEAGILDGDQLRSLFNVQNILIGRGIVNNAEEEATASLTNIWGANAVMAFVDPNPRSTRALSMGMGFRWRPEGMPTDMQVMRSQMNDAGSRHVEVIEAMYYQDEKIIAPELAYAITATR